MIGHDVLLAPAKLLLVLTMHLGTHAGESLKYWAAEILLGLKSTRVSPEL